MADQSQQKTIALAPSWKNHLAGYLLSVLCIPLFGLGLIGLYLVYKRQKTYAYTFSDTQISSQDQKYQRNIDLINIENVRIEQSWLQKKMGVGNIVLQTSASSMTLRGIDEPFGIKRVLDKAIAAEKQRQREKEKTEPQKPDHDPGTKNRMDYLTGLWQQGLVSDEDYEKERKHFE